jgi:transposase
MALIMVMGLALLMYSLAEHWIRQSLKEKKETIPNQLMKPTATPTFRRIAQIFEGIDLLRISTSDGTIPTKVLNIREIPQNFARLELPALESSKILRYP